MTLFEEDTQPAIDYFNELVGDGKKFKDQQALAYSKVKADEQIQRLELEMSELRKDLKARTTLEELADRWANSRTQTDSLIDVYNQEHQTASDPLTSEKVENILDTKISKYLTEHERQKLQQSNAAIAKEELRKIFGDSYTAKVREELQKIGMSEEDANDLAARSPKAFIRLFQTRSSENFSAPPKSSVTSQFVPSNKGRTMSYYEGIRKADPNLYWNIKTQNQLHEDAIQLGEDFFDA